MTLLTSLLLLLTTSTLPLLTSARRNNTNPSSLHAYQTILPHNIPRDILSTTTTTTTETVQGIAIWTTLPMAQQTADPLCINEADPDAGIDNHCVCGTEGGDYTTLPNIQLPKATVTGADGGLVVNASDYNPCGWTMVTVTGVLAPGGVVVTVTGGEGWNATVTGVSLEGSGGVVSTSGCTSLTTGDGKNVPRWGGRRRMI